MPGLARSDWGAWRRHNIYNNNQSQHHSLIRIINTGCTVQTPPTRKIINQKVGTTCWLTQSLQCWRILRRYLFHVTGYKQKIWLIIYNLLTGYYSLYLIGSLLEGKYNNHLNLIRRLFMMLRYISLASLPSDGSPVQLLNNRRHPVEMRNPSGHQFHGNDRASGGWWAGKITEQGWRLIFNISDYNYCYSHQLYSIRILLTSTSQVERPTKLDLTKTWWGPGLTCYFSSHGRCWPECQPGVQY